MINRLLSRYRWLALGCLLILGVVVAQAESCPAIVERALSAVDALCEQVGRNQACYGNVNLSAQAQPGVAELAFGQVGDVANVADIWRLSVSPMNENTGEWGVAVLRLQADIPDALPGQNVTFLLFGDVEVTSAITGDEGPYNPMQAFYLRTGIGQPGCVEAPENGLLVQTPEGVGQLHFNINGVDVEIGSTVFLQAQDETGMTITTIEGSALVRRDDAFFPIIAGTRALLPHLPAPDGLPVSPVLERYDVARMQTLPLRLLQRRITVAPPLSDDALNRLRQRLRDGLAPCGIEPLPPCEAFSFRPDRPWTDQAPVILPRLLDNRLCVFRPRAGDRPLPPNETRPFCPDPIRPRDDRPCVFRPRVGDPPLPPNETRPFCPDPPSGGNDANPGGGNANPGVGDANHASDAGTGNAVSEPPPSNNSGQPFVAPTRTPEPTPTEDRSGSAGSNMGAATEPTSTPDGGNSGLMPTRTPEDEPTPTATPR